MEARNRKLEIWYRRIKEGELKLPRFQRFEAWDKNRISSLLEMIINDLPLGITLILEVDQEKFISRYLQTAEILGPPPRVIEHLLDGQQRLTALWRVLHNNYSDVKYFVYLPEYDVTWEADEKPIDENDVNKVGYTIYARSRWKKPDGTSMPLWADDPESCLKRGCIPCDLLRPEEISDDVDKWISEALKFQKPKRGADNFEQLYEQYSESKTKLSTLIQGFRERIKNYNLPFLALPSDTSKDVALSVFINMNTNSKPLSQYDIIVAEIEGLGTSLHGLQRELNEANPSVAKYFDLSYLILYTAALMQEKVPNKVGIWDMDKKVLVGSWPLMTQGLARMTTFLARQRIYDEARLPTNAVLAVIAALYTQIPEKGDKAGQAEILLKKYLWSSFFTDRYENSAASRAYMDFMALSSLLGGKLKVNGEGYQENDVPVLNRSLFPIATPLQLLNVGWPKNVGIRGRGILAVANYFGANDFADGSQISSANVVDREYHHIFPDALITEANTLGALQIQSSLALNCALVTGKTNRVIGRKDPLVYLKDRYDWATQTIIHQRLDSHLIPVGPLEKAQYSELAGDEKAQKINSDFHGFLNLRAHMVSVAVEKLIAGEEVQVSEVIQIANDIIAKGKVTTVI